MCYLKRPTLSLIPSRPSEVHQLLSDGKGLRPKTCTYRLVLEDSLWAVRLPVLDPVPDMPWSCLWSSPICSLANTEEPAELISQQAASTFLKGTNLSWTPVPSKSSLYPLPGIESLPKGLCKFFLSFLSCIAPVPQLGWLLDFPCIHHIPDLTWTTLLYPFFTSIHFLCVPLPTSNSGLLKKPFLITLTQWPISLLDHPQGPLFVLHILPLIIFWIKLKIFISKHIEKKHFRTY